MFEPKCSLGDYLMVLTGLSRQNVRGTARFLRQANIAEGAAEDAQTALDFYREHDVDSQWAREAEEILENAQAHDAS